MLPVTNDSAIILLPTNKGIAAIDINTIIRIQSSSNYSKLFFSNGKTLVVAKVLAWFEGKLPPQSFVRIHRSHIISLHHVLTCCNNGNNKIILCNNTAVDVSRRKKTNSSENIKGLKTEVGGL